MGYYLLNCWAQKGGYAASNPQLPPKPVTGSDNQSFTGRREVDNRPAWLSSSPNKKLVTFSDTREVPEDRDRKKARQWVLSAVILNTSTSEYVQPMPLDVDNGLPGIEMWFGKNEDSEVGFLCHLDTCAAMNTGNLRVHQWLMTQYPDIVAEYLQYDDETPFEPLQLQVAIKDVEKAESKHGKLTAIVRYHLRYKQGNNKCFLSFGLGSGVTVNSIIGIPTMRQWGGLFDFGTNVFTAQSLNTKFSLKYEVTAQDLPPHVQFDDNDFVRPHSSTHRSATALVTNTAPASSTNNSSSTDNSVNQSSCRVTESTNGTHLKRAADVSHLL